MLFQKVEISESRFCVKLQFLNYLKSTSTLWNISNSVQKTTPAKIEKNEYNRSEFSDQKVD